MKVHEITVGLTIAMELAEEDAEGLDLDDYAKEEFLVYLGSVSDGWIMDGLDVQIITREEKG